MAALSAVPLVKALVPDAIFKRGKELSASHKLHFVKFEGSGLENATASCAGSNEGDTYRLSIVISADSASKPKYECSCPAAVKAKGGLCKHIVALLLLRIKELTKSSEPTAKAKIVSGKSVEEVRQTASSDSQLTEPWRESDEAPTFVDNAPTSSAPATLQGTDERKHRSLPAWMMGRVHAETTVGEQGKGKCGKAVSSKLKKRNTVGDSDDDENKERTSTGETGGRRGLANSVAARGDASRERKTIVASRRRKRLKRQVNDTIDEDIEELDQDLLAPEIAVPRRGTRKKKEQNCMDEELKDDDDDDSGTVSIEQERVNPITVRRKRDNILDTASNKKEAQNVLLQAESDLSDEGLTKELNLEDEELEVEQKRVNSKTGGQMRSRAALKNKEAVSGSVAKSRKKVLLAERNLSSEDMPEVDHELNSTVSQDNSKLGIVLTTEDLVSMAKQHLEGANGNRLSDGDDCCEQDRHEERKNHKKDDSIFSVREWKGISTMNSDAKDTDNEQFFENKYPSGFPAALGLDSECDDNSDRKCEGSLVSRSEKNGDGALTTADNVAEDMLNLLFGPSFSTAASVGNTQMYQEDVTRGLSQTDVPEHLRTNLAPPVTVEGIKPKKKGSLKDKVMMFLS